MHDAKIQNINFEIHGMRELYYTNIISFETFKKLIDNINKKYKLTFKKVIDNESYEPFTNIVYCGYDKNNNNVYSIYINESIQ